MTTVQFASFPRQKPCRTKIVATVGPASNSDEMIEQLIIAGVDVFRLNFAHGTPEQNAPVLERIRRISQDLHQPIAVLADLAGPKMRLGEIPGGEYECRQGEIIHFVRGDETDKPDSFTSTYEQLIDDVNEGDKILLADGTIELKVVRKGPLGIDCEITQGGKIRSRQGINLPGIILSIKTLQPHDMENAVWATKAGIDFLGLSFVRTPGDIVELRDLLRSTAREKYGSDAWDALSKEEQGNFYPNIIAKIEKPETLDCLDEIISEADGVMIARGDLGVEMDIARIALVQKQIISICRQYTRPVIVATQMLESMTEESMPTRAEVTDVTNAILDGTDACMLSGETAVGKHPLLAVQTMNRIARETEKELAVNGHRYPLGNDPSAGAPENDLPEPVKISLAVCDVTGELADRIKASMILVATKSGRTALNFSKMRNMVMTAGTSETESVLRRLCLYWGVIPVGGVPSSPVQMLENFVELAEKADYLHPGDRVVLTAGMGAFSDCRNAIYVHTIPEKQ